MDYSIKEWDGFYESNDVLVPYLDVCVFASKRLRALPPGAAIYEFGCGNGNNLRFLKSLFPGTRILGSDISSVAIAKLRAAEIGNSHFWINEDALNIPEAIDVAIERGAMQHVSKERARLYVDEIHQALKPSGEAFFEIASREHSLYGTLGDGGDDPAVGLRTFYSLPEIETLFSRFKIARIWHLKREVVADANGSLGATQGSYQVELRKT